MSLVRRPTAAEINLDALRHNFYQVRTRSGKKVKILAVVKANAYGHGAVVISQELQKLGVDFLGVATCEEGIELRNARLTTPIIVLEGFTKGQGNYVKQYNLIPVIYDLASAEELSRVARRSNCTLKIHVKVDTGMGRLGIIPKYITSFFQHLAKLPGLTIEGVLTHLADNMRGTRSGIQFTQRQVRLFKEQMSRLHQMGIYPRYQHLHNSAAIIDKKPRCLNLVRPGIILYGTYPAARFTKVIDLKPVMSLKTRIISLKTVPKGTTISYGRTFRCTQEALIATLPIGYADGYSRFLSNKGEVLIRGHRAPVVGVVCMDMVMVDVTGIPGVRHNDEVVLMGSQGTEKITVEEIAEKIGTIPYEVLCGISQRVPRVYIRGGEISNIFG